MTKIIVTILTIVSLLIFTACNTERDSGQNSASPIQELVLLVNDSFDIGQDIIENFEMENNAKLVIRKGGSSGQVLNMALLEKGNPSGDLLYGIDNTYLSRSLEEEIFIEYQSPLLENIKTEMHMDRTYHVTPVDYGYVNINYDKDYLATRNLAIPKTLEELTEPQWKSALVVQNPATSSPGLAFLISTVYYFGEDDDYDYLDYWKDLRANDILVKDSWTDAYYTEFSLYGGDRPLVLSYSTSPAAEVFFSDGKYTEPPTGNVLIDKATFLQIEGIGILKGTDKVDLAKKFVDYTIDLNFQEDIPSRMFVYPVNSIAKLPDYFSFAKVDSIPQEIDSKTINDNRDRWIDSWINVTLR